MSISEEQVTNALKSVKYPGFTRDIVSFGLLKSVHIDDGEVKVQLARAANGHGREQDRSDRAIRLAPNVDGISPRRYFSGDFTRADGDALHSAILEAGRMGRAGLFGSGSSSRHRGHPAYDRANGRPFRSDHRHYATGGGSHRRAQGRYHV